LLTPTEQSNTYNRAR